MTLTDVVDVTTSPSPLPPPPPPTSQRPSRAGRVVGAATACAVLSAGVSYATVKLTESGTSKVTYVATAPGTAGGAAGSTVGDLHQLLAKVTPAVVAIEVGSGTGSDATPVAAGSGVVISNDGLLLTNAHVVHPTDQAGKAISNPVFTVKMSDGTVRAAKVLSASDDYDIALMQLTDTTDLHPLALADATLLRVGDAVVAIGNALNLGDAPTVTTGIISALDRTVRESSSVTLHGLIQTDAAINHGNSGGALVNANGELVGINSAGYTDAQNIGFAISVATIKPLLTDLKAGKDVKASPIGFIGVNVAETPYGLTVTTVQSGTPASDVGIRAGDIISQVGTTKISTVGQLQSLLRTTAPGTVLAVSVQRDGKPLQFKVTLAKRPTP